MTFTITATANTPPVSAYAWYYNNSLNMNGWQLVSGNIAGATGTNTATLTLPAAGLSQLLNYQFYCQVTEIDGVTCEQYSRAARYTYPTKAFYRAITAVATPGEWTIPGSWQMSDDGVTNFVATCAYPTAANSAAVIIPDGMKIIHSTPTNLDIDKLSVEEDGAFELGSTSALKILNGQGGADFIVKGIFTYKSSVSPNGLQFEDNTGTANDASWQLDGIKATIIKTNTASVADLRDFYNAGISTISQNSSWIYRKETTGTPITVSAGMYYPNLYFESTGGAFSWNTSNTALDGAANTMTVYGNFMVGTTPGSDPVSVYYNNINASPMQVGGNLEVNAGSLLTNLSYDNTVTAARGHGTGVEVKGNITVNGTLTLNANNKGLLKLSGIGDQIISGTGAENMNIENLEIDKLPASKVINNRKVNVYNTFAPLNSSRWEFGSGDLVLKSNFTKTARVEVLTGALITYPAAGRFVVERYINYAGNWNLL
ncbi:MAG: hypothetical protein EOP49_34540, partial [Sphingobacteriales bacterium]